MKTIKVNFVDFPKKFDIYNNDFIEILREKYAIEISDDPDYLFYSCFGYKHAKYNCVRIFYTGECVTPDFNICDYAIGFDFMSFSDRYLRVPLYCLFNYKSDYEMAKNKHLHADDITGQDRKFCSFVVSNDAGQKARKEMFDLLSSYKQVDSGGRYLNNIGYCVPDKNVFQSQYKFSFAFENCVYPGYTTEKLPQAFAAGTIPIYYGNPEIAKEFNEDAFVNCHQYDTWETVLKRICEIDNNDELYAKMLGTSINVGYNNYYETLREFLFHIVEQGPSDARRRPLNTRLKDLDAWQLYIYYSAKVFKPFKRLSNMLRRILNDSLKR